VRTGALQPLLTSCQDTIPELMDKLRNVEPADLGFDDLSDDEEQAVHVSVKGAVTTRRTRVLKGVKLDKTFEPPSHYMCERCDAAAHV
jgi:hypothetical protein